MRSSTGEVRGQATAAALWAMSCIGIIVGTGHAMLGAILTLSVYLIIAWDAWPIMSRLNQRLKKRKAKELQSQQTNGTDKPDE